MAAGKVKMYDKAGLNCLTGPWDWDSLTFNAVLLSSASNANTLTSIEVYADWTNELTTANGYTIGGQALTSVTVTRTGNVTVWTAAAPVWTATGTLAARFVGIYVNSTVNSKVKPLVGVVLVDTTPADVTATAGNTWTFTPNAGGLLTWTTPNSDT